MESGAIRAFLVTPDARLVATFADACSELGIQVSAASSERFPEELAAGKYEAVLIDFDSMSTPLAMLNAVRQSPSSRNALILAVTTEACLKGQAFANGADVVLERPVDPKEVRRILDGSYQNMVLERRRYFRCTAEIPALLIRTQSGGEFKCTTMNVSSSGVALRTPIPLEAGEEVQLVVFLQDKDAMVRAIGTVIWDDKHGKTGISFECTNAQHQAALDTWLDAQFANSNGRLL